MVVTVQCSQSSAMFAPVSPEMCPSTQYPVLVMVTQSLTQSRPAPAAQLLHPGVHYNRPAQLFSQ